MDTENQLRAEIAYLNERIRALEAERVEHDRRANATIAAAQERAYWLDRWHLDLNALMERPGADRARAAARGMRGPVRWLRLLVRRLRG
jgi:septal ring factor EnvC (AmiA/AmiB activator)